MSPGRRASSFVVGAALGGQRLRRLHRLVPPPVRGRLTRMMSAWLARSDSTGLLDDWSQPLSANWTPPVAGPMTTLRAATGAPRLSVVRAGAPCARGGRDRPRCLLVTSCLDAGGMDEMVAFLARHLSSQGLHTAVLHTTEAGSTPPARGRLAETLRVAGIEVSVLGESAARGWIHDWRPDVISAHGAPAWVLEAAGADSVPYVDVLHGMHSLFDVDWAAEAERNRHIAAIVAVSELVRRQYLAGAPLFPPGRIITIANGVDHERRAPIERSAARAALGLGDEFLFVSLARHCLQKNTYGLVSAFESVASAHPDAHLLIAGRPEDALYCAQVRRLRDGLDSRHRIHLRDHAADPGLVLSAADGFVLNSFFEGWALASMEALHAGIPVVTSNVGGAREQVGVGGDRGRVVANPLGDPLQVSWKSMRSACYAPQVNRGELIEAMNAVAADRRRWAQRRQALAAESADRFHPDRCANDHAALLHSLAGGQAKLHVGESA